MAEKQLPDDEATREELRRRAAERTGDTTETEPETDVDDTDAIDDNTTGGKNTPRR